MRFVTGNMIDSDWFFLEIERRSALNEQQGVHLDTLQRFESSAFYFGAASALRELAEDANNHMQESNNVIM